MKRKRFSNEQIIDHAVCAQLQLVDRGCRVVSAASTCGDGGPMRSAGCSTLIRVWLRR
jgi:hypothetical protein